MSASFAEAAELATQAAQPGDMILTLGAGNVSQLGPQVLEALESRVAATQRRCQPIAVTVDSATISRLGSRDDAFSLRGSIASLRNVLKCSTARKSLQYASPHCRRNRI